MIILPAPLTALVRTETKEDIINPPSFLAAPGNPEDLDPGYGTAGRRASQLQKKTSLRRFSELLWKNFCGTSILGVTLVAIWEKPRFS
jgi:hypothetical protein